MNPIPRPMRLSLLLTLAILAAGLALLPPRLTRLRHLRDQSATLERQEIAAQTAVSHATTAPDGHGSTRTSVAARPAGELKLQAARQLSRDLLATTREQAAETDRGHAGDSRQITEQRTLQEEQLRQMDIGQLRAFIDQAEKDGGTTDPQTSALLIRALGHLVRLNPSLALATLARLSADPLFAANACPRVIRRMEPGAAESAALELPDPYVQRKTLERIYASLPVDTPAARAARSAFAGRHAIPF